MDAAPLLKKLDVGKHENIYTIPNALTLGRILATPVIGYYVLQGEIAKATALLFVAGVSDLVSEPDATPITRVLTSVRV